MSKFAKKSTHTLDSGYNIHAPDYKSIATKENALVCTVGRMNPPTPGHMKLVRRLIATAVELNLDEVQVFLSSNNKDNKNPLICEEDKKRFLEKMTESMQSKLSDPAKSVHVKFECFANPVVAIFGKIKEKKDALSEDPVHIFMTLGEDRDSISSSLIKKPDPRVKMHEDLLPRSGMTERIESLTSATETPMASSEEDASISGTYVRGLVESDNLEVFEKVYSNYLLPGEARELFFSIKSGMDKFHAEFVASKPEGPKPSRYSRRKRPSPTGSPGKSARKSPSPKSSPGKSARKSPSPEHSPKKNSPKSSPKPSPTTEFALPIPPPGSPPKTRRSARLPPIKKGGKRTRKN